ncbi:MAG: 3-hydroxybutyryl-CoA dehydrogenase [Gammaproteobacteria bacterium]|nr:3-hydroxybutyryl-CoA dehydrogenase [Gammaproteobacteria bacterium]MDH3537370.1 3-hydroxybutyryl-CoA dehydrogenase [Gammaproteobacteria bacterium]
MNIKAVGVVGAGTMGNGIAQVCAAAGLKVIMQDIGETQVERGLNTIATSLDRLIKKEKISNKDKETTLAIIETTTSLAQLADVDIVIEAATENESLKLDIFKQLDKLCKPDAILASNTSSISLTRIAGATQRAGQVIGMHFMNPVPMMTLVEVIRALQTTDAVYRQVHALSEFIGKVPVEAKDSPGFVANRILIPMINEAAYVYYEGLASAEGIDEIMKLGMAHPMGPLMLADLIGLDTCYAVIKVLHEGFGDSKYRPCPIWRQMVDAGYLGRKTGRGFYTYDE